MYTYDQLAEKIGLTVEKKILGPQYPNIPDEHIAGGEMGWDLVTVHDTANGDVGANAEMHWRFVKGGGGKDTVSFTFAVDQDKAIQILSLDQVNYAQGTPAGNRRSISIEMCINRDGNFDKTVGNTAKLVAALLAWSGKPRTAIVQHNRWYGKDCPGKLRHTPGGWEAFITRVGTEIGNIMEALRAEEGEQIGEFRVREPFLSLWHKYGLEVMGYPISEPYTEKEPALNNEAVMYQDFENVVGQWYEGLLEARIAAGIRKYKYGK